MTPSPKLEKGVYTQLAIGVILMAIGSVWLFTILYLLRPDQILPTSEHIKDAWIALTDVTSIPRSMWSLGTMGSLIVTASTLICLNILFVVARYGGLTLLFLGCYAVFESLVYLRNARRSGKAPRS